MFTGLKSTEQKSFVFGFKYLDFDGFLDNICIFQPIVIFHNNHKVYFQNKLLNQIIQINNLRINIIISSNFNAIRNCFQGRKDF